MSILAFLSLWAFFAFSIFRSFTGKNKKILLILCMCISPMYELNLTDFCLFWLFFLSEHFSISLFFFLSLARKKILWVVVWARFRIECVSPNVKICNPADFRLFCLFFLSEHFSLSLFFFFSLARRKKSLGCGVSQARNCVC